VYDAVPGYRSTEYEEGTEELSGHTVGDTVMTGNGSDMEREPRSVRPVVAVLDSGPCWELVVRLAAEEATSRGTGLCVVPAVPWPPASGGVQRPAPTEHAQKTAAEVTALVHREFPYLAVQALPYPGRFEAALAAASREATLVVVGCRRGFRAGGRRDALGPWFEAGTGCPVMFVSLDRADSAGAGRVVVGVGEHRTVRAALAFAFTEASLRREHLEIVHATRARTFTPPLGVPGGYDRAGASHLAEVAVLGGAVELSREYPQVPVTTRVARGRPVAVLRQATEDAGLLVVGAGHRSALRGLRGGPVVGRLACSARCPVVGVPESALREGGDDAAGDRSP
jgi:nucleotide-binding universal stress UspA family protein